jgi:hypothetical protein
VRSFIFSISFVFFLFGCADPYKEESRGLNTLLHDFNTCIASKNHLYILIPTFSCLECVQIALIKLEDILVENDKPNVTIIYQKIDIDFNPFENKALVYYDINNSIDKLPFSIANMTIIKTRKGMINEIRFVNVENINQVINRNIINEIRK